MGKGMDWKHDASSFWESEINEGGMLKGKAIAQIKLVKWCEGSLSIHTSEKLT